jgi:hypothetical protein
MGNPSVGEVVIADSGIGPLPGQLITMSPCPRGFIKLEWLLTGISIQKLLSHFDVHKS